MFNKSWSLIITAICCVILYSNSVWASQPQKKREDKTAIVIASFGTTVPRAVVAITNITERVKKAYPNTEVRITFTSNIIRKVWRKRQAEPQKWLDMGIPKEVLYVKNIISTMGDLREEGYNNIIVQPTHMFYMEQSHDLNAYVRALGSIRTMKDRWRPFDKVVMGRPALGMPGDKYDYHEDVAAAVATLAADAKQAEENGAMLVYMGHGNEYWSTGIYSETQEKMREVYPQVETFIGVVEGSPTLDQLLDDIAESDKKKIILRPFMIVAGDHAVNDMAGEEEDSWKSVLTAKGYQVDAVLTGLGSNNDFADIFVQHIEDVAKAHNLTVQ